MNAQLEHRHSHIYAIKTYRVEFLAYSNFGTQDEAMTLEHLLIAWSIRLSMLLFVLVIASRIVNPRAVVDNTIARSLWTIAFVLFVVHVLASFHFAHQWSHDSAYQAIAKQTLELLGFEVGMGVYFNYLFLAVWALDVINAWTPIAEGRRAVQWLLCIGLIYMIFIAFNGIVVFKSGWLRFVGLVASALLLAAFVNKRARLPATQRKESGLNP